MTWTMLAVLGMVPKWPPLVFIVKIEIEGSCCVASGEHSPIV